MINGSPENTMEVISNGNNSYTIHNLLDASGEGTFSITNGEILWTPKGGNEVKLHSISILSKTQMELFGYKSGKTYSLTRI